MAHEDVSAHLIHVVMGNDSVTYSQKNIFSFWSSTPLKVEASDSSFNIPKI